MNSILEMQQLMTMGQSAPDFDFEGLKISYSSRFDEYSDKNAEDCVATELSPEASCPEKPPDQKRKGVASVSGIPLKKSAERSPRTAKTPKKAKQAPPAMANLADDDFDMGEQPSTSDSSILKIDMNRVNSTNPAAMATSMMQLLVDELNKIGVLSVGDPPAPAVPVSGTKIFVPSRYSGKDLELNTNEVTLDAAQLASIKDSATAIMRKRKNFQTLWAKYDVSRAHH